MSISKRSANAPRAWARGFTDRSASAICFCGSASTQRAAALKANAPPDKAAEIDIALARLIAEGARGMGELFKAIAIAAPQLGRASGIRGGVMKLQAQSLTLTGIRHAFFTRAGGVSGGLYASLNGGTGSNDDAAKVAENRARMAAALGVEPHRFLTLYQIHSPNVVVAETPWPADERPRADAIVTRMRALAIGVTTADCGPVLFADPQAGVIGAAHAGWRGALGGVIEATIVAMERLGAARGQIRAAIGPMIRQANYEVGSDLIARFAAEDRASSRFFAPAARQRSCPVRSFRLCRGPPGAGRRWPCRGSRPVHLCRSGAVFQLPPHHPPRRAGLRPPRQCDRSYRRIGRSICCPRARRLCAGD